MRFYLATNSTSFDFRLCLCGSALAPGLNTFNLLGQATASVAYFERGLQIHPEILGRTKKPG
jgi:hypothetical protein